MKRAKGGRARAILGGRRLLDCFLEVSFFLGLLRLSNRYGGLSTRFSCQMPSLVGICMGIALRLVDFYLFWRLWVVVDFVVEGGKKGLDVGRYGSREGKEGGGCLGCIFGGGFPTPVGLGDVDGRA